MAELRNAGLGSKDHKTPAAAWWMLFVLFLLFSLSYVDRFIITMLVVPIKADLGLSDVQIGILLGPAFAVFFAIFGIPLGWAADRYPRRWVIYIGATIWSLAAMASGLARSFVGLFMARVVIGAGEASLSPAAFNLMADVFPKSRLTLALSIYQSGVKIGSVVAFTVGGLLIALTNDWGIISLPVLGAVQPWQMVLLLTGAPGVLVALLVFTFAEPAAKAPSEKVQSGGIMAFYKAERTLMLCMLFGFSLVMVCVFSLASWVPTYMTREFGWTPVQYGPVLSVIGIAAAGSMVLKGWIVDWLHVRLGIRDIHLRFYTWLLLVSVPLGTVAFFVSSPLLFLILYGAVQVIAVQFIVFLVATLQIVVPGEARGRTTGVFLAVFNLIGLGIGPLVTAFITDYVFKDEAMLGMSLAITSLISLGGGWILLRIALGALGGALDRADDRKAVSV